MDEREICKYEYINIILKKGRLVRNVGVTSRSYEIIEVQESIAQYGFDSKILVIAYSK